MSNSCSDWVVQSSKLSRIILLNDTRKLEHTRRQKDSCIYCVYCGLFFKANAHDGPPNTGLLFFLEIITPVCDDIERRSIHENV